jgi:excisionase family DNA binding protein
LTGVQSRLYGHDQNDRPDQDEEAPMCATAATETPDLPLWLSVDEFAEAVGIGQTLAGELAKDGHLLRAHRHGVRRVIRIHRDSVAAYLDATLIRPEGSAA